MNYRVKTNFDRGLCKCNYIDPGRRNCESNSKQK